MSKTPQEIIEQMAAQAGYPTEVYQEDDGSGYVVLIVATPQGEITVSVDTTFGQAPEGMDSDTGRAPADDWLKD